MASPTSAKSPIHEALGTPVLTRQNSFDLESFRDSLHAPVSESGAAPLSEETPLMSAHEPTRTTIRRHHLPLPSTTPDSKKRNSREPSPAKTRWATFLQRSKYYMPGLKWIPSYSSSSLTGDIAAGVSVASVIIPQSMSYATSLAHVDASSGLLAASIPGLVYGIFGTCAHLNVGPEAALTLLVGQAVSSIVRGDPHSGHGLFVATAVSTMITFQVGLISFLLGLLRLGFMDVILSRALLRCCHYGRAINPDVGLEVIQHEVSHPPGTTLEKIAFLIDNAFTPGKGLTAAISFTSFFILFIARAVKRRMASVGGKWKWAANIPEVFILVVVTTIFSDVYDWPADGVTVLGRVKVNFGTLVDWPLKTHTVKYLKKTTSTAILISIAGYLDSILGAKQNSDRFGYSISPNRELVAIGAGNLVSSFFPGTLPAYGGITRSRINADSGGRTQMASVICSMLVILAVFFLLPALVYLPKCVLGAIIALVATNILTEIRHDVLYFWGMSAWTDLAMMLLTFAFTVIWSVEVGIIVSVTSSLLIIVKRSSRTHIKILGRVPDTDRWKPIEEDEENHTETPGVLIVKLKDDLDFANTGQLKERLRRLELYGPRKAHPSDPIRREEARAVVFHMSDVEKIDASAVQIFLQLTGTYKNRDVQVHFAHLKQKHLEAFRRAGMVPQNVPEHRFHKNVAGAMRAIEQSWSESVAMQSA
ncbi:sulfate transporter family-domain-containing protein [Cantharellus anzutake]|uniref:sulfate transporter family-domain-containing protein n=1 Tax=Cantharellus anzutake TaxID=1750568 RepID=UPI0019066A1A|nr:sulfate transporter family-domain-containing protein [Cantharellus anzutake]KAF8331325.1 sulfate transporter family-domain-containing protein [Cantharellus anzutake]